MGTTQGDPRRGQGPQLSSSLALPFSLSSLVQLLLSPCWPPPGLTLGDSLGEGGATQGGKLQAGSLGQPVTEGSRVNWEMQMRGPGEFKSLALDTGLKWSEEGGRVAVRLHCGAEFKVPWIPLAEPCSYRHQV